MPCLASHFILYKSSYKSLSVPSLHLSNTQQADNPSRRTKAPNSAALEAMFNRKSDEELQRFEREEEAEEVLSS